MTKRQIRPTYRTWEAMRRRCYDHSVDSYPLYGGRGVTVCDRWRNSYKNFLADMGERPHGMTLGRKDPNGNYGPENCKWATNEEQQNNKRNSKFITHRGVTKTISQWAREVGIGASTLHSRIARGMTVAAALARPISRIH